MLSGRPGNLTVGLTDGQLELIGVLSRGPCLVLLQGHRHASFCALVWLVCFLNMDIMWIFTFVDST